MVEFNDPQPGADYGYQMQIFNQRPVELGIGLPAAIAVSAGIGLAATAGRPRRIPARSGGGASSSDASNSGGSGSDDRNSGGSGSDDRRDLEDRTSARRRLGAAGGPLLTASDLPSGYKAVVVPTTSDPATFDDLCVWWDQLEPTPTRGSGRSSRQRSTARGHGELL
ncbi:hypothetical protein ACFQFC_00615 [Amorphoplanes digitatis]|uniref:Uncharacterized protein n=1 Tax=Actinoplanes digitatis TaxID=1868 RepID=A0A7W7HXP3_9ACTN|nr:hypothetical protein [Actinoplanes digitatis]MBB4762677.1 hypothetical protein [Actinoplanes digitatis]BFE71573.1 hypothetical protein GCM10020092_048740 [Actinoplanes digitatis]GID91823.1 hypothetical protein Adi01nite_12350 [Actinoplanes digitatis]